MFSFRNLLPRHDRSVKLTFVFFVGVFGLGTWTILLWAIAYAVDKGHGLAWPDVAMPFAAAFFEALSLFGMLGLAAAVIGGLLGFLFGIPRSHQDGAPGNAGTRPGAPSSAPPRAQAPAAPSAAAQAASNASSARWASNTNLEQVSDWLTKILVG
ncbi:MAG TPA: hypothetical protein VET85_01815, partial [Stellaceae bacterium]|nr:hypothetical protein [Stellaceae bacterium]